MTVGERIKHCRKRLGMSAETLAEKIGKSAATVYRYENGDISNVSSEILRPIADALHTTPAYLMGWDDSINETIPNITLKSALPFRRVPILGDTAAGEPIIANREYDEYVDIPDDGAHRYDAALRVVGDSMTPKYHKGDLAFIRYQEDVLDGQIAAICLDDEVTLKRIYHIPGGVQLLSENPDYPPRVYTGEDYNNIHLVGLAVGVLHWDY